MYDCNNKKRTRFYLIYLGNNNNQSKRHSVVIQQFLDEQEIEFVDVLYETKDTDYFVNLHLIRKNSTIGISRVNFKVLVNNIEVDYKNFISLISKIGIIWYLKTVFSLNVFYITKR